MKLTILCVFGLAVITAAASNDGNLVYNTIAYPYLYNNPYAVRYAHYYNPLYLTSSSIHGDVLDVSAVKHHHPDHKGDGEDTEQTPSTDIPAQQLPKLKSYQLSYPILSPQYVLPSQVIGPNALQYHAQDELGQYQYGYSNVQSSKHEHKSFDGITRGAYSYVDSNGKLQTVNYVSDAFGFRVVATNLPEQQKPVEIPDSDEIAAAKKEHFKAHKDAIDRLNKAKTE